MRSSYPCLNELKVWFGVIGYSMVVERLHELRWLMLDRQACRVGRVFCLNGLDNWCNVNHYFTHPSEISPVFLLTTAMIFLPWCTHSY